MGNYFEFLGPLMIIVGIAALYYNKDKKPKEPAGYEKVGYLNVQYLGYYCVGLGFLIVIIELVKLFIDPNFLQSTP